MQSSPASRHFLPLSPNTLLNILLSNLFNLREVWKNKFHIHTKQQVKLWFYIF